MKTYNTEKKTVTEWCAHCNTENTIEWDKTNYVIYCPHCGEKILLCDACTHAEDNPDGKCDWCENKGCFRVRKQNPDLRIMTVVYNTTADIKIKYLIIDTPRKSVEWTSGVPVGLVNHLKGK